MALIHTDSYLEDSLAVFRYYQGLGERAIAQLSDEQLFGQPDAESNSIAIIVKHLAGNMRSRWTDLFEQWQQAWAFLYAALEPLTDADLTRTITIRGEPHSVMHLASDHWTSLSETSHR